MKYGKFRNTYELISNISLQAIQYSLETTLMSEMHGQSAVNASVIHTAPGMKNNKIMVNFYNFQLFPFFFRLSFRSRLRLRRRSRALWRQCQLWRQCIAHHHWRQCIDHLVAGLSGQFGRHHWPPLRSRGAVGGGGVAQKLLGESAPQALDDESRLQLLIGGNWTFWEVFWWWMWFHSLFLFEKIWFEFARARASLKHIWTIVEFLQKNF